MNRKNDMPVYVLFRFSKKTGKIDTTMTGITSAMMELWAMQNTTKTKGTLIINRDTGAVKMAVTGTADGWPKIKKDCGRCDKYGIPFEALQAITDDRFD